MSERKDDTRDRLAEAALARDALLSWDERVEPMEPLLDRFEAAIRAEYSEHVDRYQYETDTAMDYGAGYLEGKRESAETLAALREALGPVLVEADELIENDRWADGPPNSVITRLEYAVIALRAALDATPAEDARMVRVPDLGDARMAGGQAGAESAQELAALREALTLARRAVVRGRGRADVSTVDEAWKALNRETGWSKADTIARHRPAIEAAVRAECREGYAQGMQDLSVRHDRAGKLAWEAELKRLGRK